MTIDREWFKEQAKKSSGSVRALAQELGKRQKKVVDHATVVRMFAGKRAILLEEAVLLADLFGVSLDEIARRAGLKKR